MIKFLNKGISTSLAFTIIIVLVALVCGGILTYQYYWLPKEAVKKSEIETPKDETTNWQTYRNEEYGFEMKYPVDWEVNAEKLPTWSEKAIDPYYLLLSIKDKTGSRVIRISAESDLEPHSLKDWIKIEENNPVEASFSNLENISVAGVPAERGTFGCCMSYLETIFFVRDNIIFGIQGGNLGIYPHIEHYDYEDVFDQIFSTFKFIEEDETTKCSPINFSGYELAKDETGTKYEFKVDLNNDGENEIVRVYNTVSNNFGERVGPNMIKIFTGNDDCPKEIFSHGGSGNFVWGAQILNNFFGNGYTVVLIKDASSSMGCGGTIHLLLLTYKNGEYITIKGPDYGSFGLHKFDGENGIGNKIIIAETKWEDDYCCGCEHKLQFYIYTWDGQKYIKTEAGITENKYLNESIDEILQKEPSVLNSD
jgi:hypothetical protein